MLCRKAVDTQAKHYLNYCGRMRISTEIRFFIRNLPSDLDAHPGSPDTIRCELNYGTGTVLLLQYQWENSPGAGPVDKLHMQ